MSLNGLDDVQVTQAYQGALAEAGGWFLLKYTSRDAVQVLTRGTGGVADARTAVANYDETSPLYGLLLYRRRKVLVKYVPEDTSRLLKARVAVHFISVTEKFAPHDIVLSISTPDELSDAALASACTLHTAAPSSSSSSTGSSRQQKLSWIREESELGTQPGVDDTAAAATRPDTANRASLVSTVLEPVASDEEPPSRNGSVASPAPEPESDPAPALDPAPAPAPAPAPVEENIVESKPPPEFSHVTIGTVTEAPGTPDADLSDIHDTLESYDTLFEAGPEPRTSSQTARPNYNELYEHYLAEYTKPKVKLGPRPRASQEGKRPHTSGSTSQGTARAVSTLPSNIRSANRKTSEKKGSRSKNSATIPGISIPLSPTPTNPALPISPISVAFTSRSSESVRSMPVPGYNGHRRPAGLSQERSRLMKAVELRKKQIKAQQDKEAGAAETGTTDPAKETESEQTDTTASDNLSVDLSPAIDSGVSFTAEDNEESDTDKDMSLGEDTPSILTLDDSGLAFAGNQMETDDLNSAASESSPISALTHGSSVAPSTRPSSVSEDEHHNSKDDQSSQNLHQTSNVDLHDEQLSVNSSPTTVVPENRTPIPSMHLRVQSNEDQISLDQVPFIIEEDYATSLMPSSNKEEVDSQQSSKPESIILKPSDGLSEKEKEEGEGEEGIKVKRRNRESMIMSKRQSWYESKEKRRTQLEPLQMDAENSETEYLSDESFMEEIQSATLQEAMHISVSKSPITPILGRFPSETSTPVRPVSQQYNKVSRPSPEPVSRKASGPWPPKHATTDPVVVTKKMNVSSGISQRIRALAEKSNRDPSSASPIGGASDAPGSSLVQRKSSFFATAPVEGSLNGRPIQRLGNPTFLSRPSSAASETRPALQPTPKATVYNVQKAEKPESVQVTARIVRDERTTQPTLAMPTQNTPLELHQSPLIIDHQMPVHTTKSPPQGSSEPTSPKAPSSSHSRDQTANLPRSSSDSGWRAFGRRMSESKSVHTVHSQESRDEKKEDKKKEKETRTSKLFKRMSSSMSAMPWKNTNTSLTLSEEDVKSTSLTSLREPPPPVQVGDLNIQFPDTLLWKRRWVEIDATGNLVLSPSRSNEKGAVKRFHLCEFQTPYPPDQDRQELPNSVVLDFVDGRTLQCACETHVAQAQVLQVLREAHDAWLAYTQAS